MAAFAFLLYALGHTALFIAAIVLLLRRRTPGTVPLVIVTDGLVYDNAMLALGGTLGIGQQLEQLSVPRYFMHAVSTPLLILTVLGLLQRTSWRWSEGAASKLLAVLVVGALIGFGFWSDMIGLQLEPNTDGGIVSYSNTNSVPIAPIAVIVVILAAAIVLWRRGSGPWLLLGALVQIVTVFVGGSIVFAGNFGELALLAGLVWTDWQMPRGNAAPQETDLTGGPV